MNDKKAIETAKKLVEFCEDQKGCQNCVFRKYGSDHWECNINAFDLCDTISNYEAKRKNHGYI